MSSTPQTSGEDGREVTAFYFAPGQGGDTPSNVNRRLANLRHPNDTPIEGKTTTRTVRGVTITQVEDFGTYPSGGPASPPLPSRITTCLAAFGKAPKAVSFSN